MKRKIGILGAGSWGTALGMVLIENNHGVKLWSRHEEQVHEINTTHTNQQYLKNIKLSDLIEASSNLEEIVKWADTLLFVIPTKATRQVAQQVASYMNKKMYIIHATKGLEQSTSKRISEVLTEELPEKYVKGVSVLSGPSHAEEVAVGDLTAITSASLDEKTAFDTQNIFINKYFRVYTNDDVIGVEFGGALKNVIALGVGVLAGLGYGDNAKAALLTRGLWEISRLGVECGADLQTFMGLGGVGDLVVTATSEHSRNYRAGYQLAQGKSLQEVESDMGMVIEGVLTTKSAYQLSKENGIEMPITTALYRVLYEEANIGEVIENLMLREKKDEFDFSKYLK